jgi:hypothetical protein
MFLFVALLPPISLILVNIVALSPLGLSEPEHHTTPRTPHHTTPNPIIRPCVCVLAANIPLLRLLELSGNSFTGPLPDFAGVKRLSRLNVNDNCACVYVRVEPTSTGARRATQAALDTNVHCFGAFARGDKATILTKIRDMGGMFLFVALLPPISLILVNIVALSPLGLSEPEHHTTPRTPHHTTPNPIIRPCVCVLAANIPLLRLLELSGNSFTGPLPDFAGVKRLSRLNVNDNCACVYVRVARGCVGVGVV